jgi:hypothetical protein
MPAQGVKGAVMAGGTGGAPVARRFWQEPPAQAGGQLHSTVPDACVAHVPPL